MLHKTHLFSAFSFTQPFTAVVFCLPYVLARTGGLLHRHPSEAQSSEWGQWLIWARRSRRRVKLAKHHTSQLSVMVKRQVKRRIHPTDALAAGDLYQALCKALAFQPIFGAATAVKTQTPHFQQAVCLTHTPQKRDGNPTWIKTE